MTMKRAANENIEKVLRRKSSGRFLDLHNQPKPKWRDALMALAAPAERVHQYRNLHKSMFYKAICEFDHEDCK
jgi:hypothetical protein